MIMHRFYLSLLGHGNYKIRLLVDWLEPNKLLLNPGKTEIIIFITPKTKVVTQILNFRIRGKKLDRKSKFEYL